MSNTIVELQVRNGCVSETYSVEQATDGAIFIHNVIDADMGGPMDTMHIDVLAAIPIARALLMAVGRINAPVYVGFPEGNVLAFPVGRA